MYKIKLTGKRGGYAIVDDQNAWLAKYTWNHHHSGYVIHGKHYKGKVYSARLHHAIIGYPLNGLQVDHINRDKLDNQHCNLRICTQSFNLTNHKNLKGRGAHGRNITKRAGPNPFVVRCGQDGRIYGGRFATLKEAQKAARQLRKKLGYARI